jgi:hypothetical protein
MHRYYDVDSINIILQLLPASTYTLLGNGKIVRVLN